MSRKGGNSLGWSVEGEERLPLDRSVSFKAVVQEGNRVQVPRLIRWQFRLESTQVLQVRIRAAERIGANLEFYYAKVRGDGRLGIPKLVMKLCRIKAGDIVDVRLSPTEADEEDSQERD